MPERADRLPTVANLLPTELSAGDAISKHADAVPDAADDLPTELPAGDAVPKHVNSMPGGDPIPVVSDRLSAVERQGHPNDVSVHTDSMSVDHDSVSGVADLVSGELWRTTAATETEVDATGWRLFPRAGSGALPAP